MVAIKSHFDGRAFVPDEPVRLQSGQAVILHVELSPAEERSSDDKSHFLNWVVDNLVEKTDLPPDGSVEHDHYIYGSPKQNPPLKSP